MKTIFDLDVRQALILRIMQLDEDSQAHWGKMNVYQMLLHNTYWNAWILGTEPHSYRQEFLGKIFGKMALRSMIKDEKPFDKNVPTSAQFKAKATSCNLKAEKAKWITLTEAYETFDNPRLIHDFFGRMTREQIGILVFKHSDHHLRQFGV